MNEPNVTFKNIKTVKGIEGLGLNADVYINGYKCFSVTDEGNGGCNIYHSYANRITRNRIKSLTQSLENYAKEKYGDLEPLDMYLAVKITELEKAKKL